MAFLGPLMGIGSSLLGGLFGSKAAKLSEEEKRLMAAREANMKQMGQMAGTLQGWAGDDRTMAQGLMRTGQGYTAPAGSYWAQNLQRSPYNRQNYLAETAGKRAEESSAYNKGFGSMLAMSPRSGAAASTMLSMPYQRGATEAANYGSWIGGQKQLQSEAAQGTANLGMGFMNQGQGIFSNVLQGMTGALGALGGAERTASSMMQPYQQQRTGSAQAWLDAGKSATPWIQKLIDTYGSNKNTNAGKKVMAGAGAAVPTGVWY